MLLCSAAARAEVDDGAVHFYAGPLAQVQYGGGAYNSRPGIAAMGSGGTWMVGVEARLGVPRGPSLMFALTARVDRFVRNGLYLGAAFGYLDEFDGEFYGGDGASAGAQVGYLIGRGRRWGQAALELQATIPLFGERPNKPGNYTFPVVSLGVRLFL